MALQTVIYNAKTPIPNVATGCCSQVYLCLSDECAELTLDGNGLILATPKNTGRYLEHSHNAGWFENPRCEDKYQYAFEYDDAQMAINPQTEEPYILPCDCIAEVNPYVCTTTRLLTGTVFYDRVCYSPLTEYPTDGLTPEEILAAGFLPGCHISLIGHVTDPNGLYMWDGVQWVQQSEYAEGI